MTISREWPRSFVVVTNTQETEAPFIYQIEQADARSSYKMVAWARMIGDAHLPATAPAEVGSPVVEPSSDALGITPTAAVEAYAAAKLDPMGEQAGLFDTKIGEDGADRDPTRSYWTALYSAVESGVSGMPAGVAQEQATLVEGSVFAVSSADSGAVVFGQIKSTIDLSFTPTPGYSMSLGSRGYLGLGASSLSPTKSAHLEFLQTVVLAVPPKGADEPIRVMAVADLPTAVSVE
jgi:hypothetical protein